MSSASARARVRFPEGRGGSLSASRRPAIARANLARSPRIANAERAVPAPSPVCLAVICVPSRLHTLDGPARHLFSQARSTTVSLWHNSACVEPELLVAIRCPTRWPEAWLDWPANARDLVSPIEPSLGRAPKRFPICTTHLRSSRAARPCDGQPVGLRSGQAGRVAGTTPGAAPLLRPGCLPYRAVRSARLAVAALPRASLEHNTTWESGRGHGRRSGPTFGIESWVVFGGSWGSTLSLAYAEAHPDRVRALVLRGIFPAATARNPLVSTRKVRAWYSQTSGRRVPGAHPRRRARRSTHAYHRRLTGDDPDRAGDGLPRVVDLGGVRHPADPGPRVDRRLRSTRHRRQPRPGSSPTTSSTTGSSTTRTSCSTEWRRSDTYRP